MTSDNDTALSRDEMRRKRIAEAGKRARAEAEERREASKPAKADPPEKGGQDGPDPARYGDWEKDGIVSDF
ncbi:MAG: DUF1674 domain-containing protein [Hyphomicrobiaceae bacterium]